jgi:hypothetical protein
MTYPTTLTKSPVNGWQAVTEVPLHDTEDGTRVLRLRTSKAKGGIAATASVFVRKDCGGYATETHAIFADFYKSGIAPAACARVTQKAIESAHQHALPFLDGLIAEATAFYAAKAPQEGDNPQGAAA